MCTSALYCLYRLDLSTVPDMTYNVFGGTLNLAHSLTHSTVGSPCTVQVFPLPSNESLFLSLLFSLLGPDHQFAIYPFDSV